MKLVFLFLLSLFISQVLVAQVDFTEEVAPGLRQVSVLDELNVTRDARLDKMLKWHIEKNEKMEGITGYRVEIFFSSKMDAREQATKAKVNFLTQYPEHAVHIKFIAPNFRVRVGDFRTKNEAWKLYKSIYKDYQAAFIVPDIIDFPLLKPNIYE